MNEQTREQDFKALDRTNRVLAELRALQREGWQTILVADLIEELQGRVSEIASRVTTSA